MAKLTVKVNKTNIKKGIQEDGESCPIAQRLHAMGFACVEVTSDYITFAEDDSFAARWNEVKVFPPDEARGFIEEFDAYGRTAVEPFEFALEVPREVLAMRKRKASR